MLTQRLVAQTVLALAATLIAPDSWADDGDLTLVVTDADGVPDVAGAVDVVTEAELRTLDADDVQQHLSHVPGVYVREEDGYGLRPNIGLRGVSGDRSAKVTLLEDGVPLAPAPYAEPAAYYFPMSARFVGIEVFKGPAAITHGPSTIGGAVNVRTRDVPTAPEGEVRLSVGLRDTLRAHAWGGVGNAQRGVLLEVAHLGTAGFKDLDGGGGTGFQRTDLMGKVRLATNPDRRTVQRLQLKLGFGREHARETYLGLTEEDLSRTPDRRYAASQRDDMRWTRGEVALTHHVTVGHRLDVQTVAYHHDFQRAWGKLSGLSDGPSLGAVFADDAAQTSDTLALLRGERDSTSAADALIVGTNARRYLSDGVDTRLRLRLPGRVARSTLQAGARVHRDAVDRVLTTETFNMLGGHLSRDNTPTLTPQDRANTALALATHLTADVDIGVVRLSPGVRQEVVRTSSQDIGQPAKVATRAWTLPGFGVRVKPTLGAQIFAGVHRGATPVGPGVSSSVRPETAWNTEIGVRLGRAGPRLDVTVFSSAYGQIVAQCTVAAGCADAQVGEAFSGGEARVLGLEAHGADTVAIAPGWTAPLSATTTVTRAVFLTDFSSEFSQYGDVTRGDALPYLPVVQGSVRAGLQHRVVSLNVGATWRSAMLDTAAPWKGDARRVPALLNVTSSVRVQLPHGVSLTATGRNLTNTRQAVSLRPYGARPTAPLQVLLGVGWRPASQADPERPRA